MKPLWEQMWAPQWAGGWTPFRVCFAVIAFVWHASRYPAIPDVYASSDFIVATGILPLPNYWILTPTSATVLWAASLVGLLLLGWGGRVAKPGLALFLVPYMLLLGSEGSNIKAYDRLMIYQATTLFFAPIDERGLTEKWRSPFARYLLILHFMALYGMTGITKALMEPAWADGSALAYNLVDQHFGLTTLGIWLSGNLALCQWLGWFTIVFELSFPLLVLSRRWNPPLLAAGVAFHIGVGLTMNIGPFSFVALAAYFVLIEPDWARQQWDSFRVHIPGADVSQQGPLRSTGGS